MPQLSGARPRAGPVRCNAGIARPPSSRLAAGRFRPAARTTWRSSIVTVRHDQIRTSAASNIPGACAADYLVPAAGQRRPASRRPAPGVPAHHLAASGLTDDLEAVTGELAANAWQHAHTPCEMRIVLHQGSPVLWEITDGGDSATEPAAAPPGGQLDRH
jgi:hypothetical protein